MPVGRFERWGRWEQQNPIEGKWLMAETVKMQQNSMEGKWLMAETVKMQQNPIEGKWLMAETVKMQQNSMEGKWLMAETVKMQQNLEVGGGENDVALGFNTGVVTMKKNPLAT